MNPMQITALGLSIVAIVFAVLLYGKGKEKTVYSPVRLMARVAVFGAMATILYAVPVFKFSLPIFPSFLELHFDEIPIFICGFAYGPLAGFLAIALKTALKLLFNPTSTLFVGELTDLILSTVYVVTATWIYQKKRNLKGVAIGFTFATLIQVFVAMLLNVYVMIPFYSQVMNYPVEVLLGLMKKTIPAITDVGWSYAFFAVLPFNLLKDAIVIVITFLVYRSLHVLLRFDKKMA